MRLRAYDPSWTPMKALVIHAASRESAEGFCFALSGLGAQLVEGGEGRWQVEIPVGPSNPEIIQALNAVEAYVSARGDPARLDLDGRRYTLHPTDADRELSSNGRFLPEHQAASGPPPIG